MVDLDVTGILQVEIASQAFDEDDASYSVSFWRLSRSRSASEQSCSCRACTCKPAVRTSADGLMRSPGPSADNTVAA
jgi:hypothetical protein